MFDYNGDGKYDAFDMTLDYLSYKQVCEEITVTDNDEQLEEIGLDVDELMFMDDDERDELLEQNGLDPDDFDF